MRITLGSHLVAKGDHGSSISQAWHSALGLSHPMLQLHKLWLRLLFATHEKHSFVDVCLKVIGCSVFQRQ